MQVYIVFKPGKNNTESVHAVFDDLETAKSSAQWLRNKFLSKGWDEWAKRVAIRSPKNAQIAKQIANELIQKSNFLDCAVMGNTFRGDGKVIASMEIDSLTHSAGLLRKFAKSIV